MQIKERYSLSVDNGMNASYLTYSRGDKCCIVKDDEARERIFYDGEMELVSYDFETGEVIVTTVDGVEPYENVYVLQFDEWADETTGYMAEVYRNNCNDDGKIYYNENGIVDYTNFDDESSESGIIREVSVVLRNGVCKFGNYYIQKISVDDNFDKEHIIGQFKKIISGEAGGIDDIGEFLGIDIEADEYSICVYRDGDFGKNVCHDSEHSSFKIGDTAYEVRNTEVSRLLKLLGETNTEEEWRKLVE